jgi:peptide/nickel transport system substrate-binding protein
MKKAVLVPLALAAIASPSLAQKSGGTLRLGMQTDPVNLDPHVTTATSTRNQLENVYDTLVSVDSGNRIVAGLAKSWGASQNGLVWTQTSNHHALAISQRSTT